MVFVREYRDNASSSLGSLWCKGSILTTLQVEEESIFPCLPGALSHLDGATCQQRSYVYYNNPHHSC